ncbi:hypothetical protein DFS34DRAFT_634331 [Phlyctochytrium arcticum]|nr:hypothetical protein DFS34DRAFT_634331 [Phlyctochytrium arcticum]
MMLGAIQALASVLLIYPYLSYLLPILSLFGLVFLLSFAAGSWKLWVDSDPRRVSYSPPRIDVNSKHGESAIPEVISVTPAIDGQLEESLYQVFEALWSALFEISLGTSKRINVSSDRGTDFQEVESVEGPSAELKSLFQNISFLAASRISAWYRDKSHNHVELALYSRFVQKFREHVKCVRQTRLKLLSEHVKRERGIARGLNAMKEHGHFLDMMSESSTDDGAKESDDIDTTNQLIVRRMTGTGQLHNALSGGKTSESKWLRRYVDRLWTLLEEDMSQSGFLKRTSGRTGMTNDTFTPSKVIRGLVREGIMSKIMLPAMQLLSNPNYINSYLNRKAQVLHVALQGAEQIRRMLNAHFTLFPPIFMHSSTRRSWDFSIMQKWRYLESLAIYIKKSCTIMDALAMRTQIRNELRRLTTKRIHADEHPDILKRYNKGLKSLQKKLDKRIAMLSIQTSNRHRDPVGEPVFSSHEKGKDFSLQELLNEYAEGGHTGSADDGMIYFADFLEERGIGFIKVRFWTAAETYRELWARLTAQSLELEGEIIGVEARLRKEATRIYEEFFSTFISPRLTIEDASILADIRQFGDGMGGGFESSKSTKCLESVIRAQEIIYEELQSAFRDFQQSDYFFKWRSEHDKLQLDNVLEKSLASDEDAVTWESSNLPKESSKGSIHLLLDRELDSAAYRMLQQNNSDDAMGRREFYRKKSAPGSQLSKQAATSIFERSKNDLESEIADLDVHGPGELLYNTAKVQLLQERMESAIAQLQFLNTLHDATQPVPPDKLTRARYKIILRVKDRIRQEIGDISKEQAKCELQEQKDAIIPGQCVVHIEAAIDGPDNKTPHDSLKKSTFYVIQIRKNGESGWTVKRRYSDFHALHRTLCKRFPVVNEYELPGKVLGFLKGRHELKQARMKLLGKYLQRLVDHEAIAASPELRSFLSSTFDRHREHMKTIRNADGRRASRQPLSHICPSGTASKTDETFLQASDHSTEGSEREEADWFDSSDEATDSSGDEIWADAQDSAMGHFGEPEGGHNSAEAVADPLIGLLLEVFEFKEQSLFSKRTAAGAIAKELLGGRGSLDSQLSDFMSAYVQPSNVTYRLFSLLDHIKGLKPGSGAFSSWSVQNQEGAAQTGKRELREAALRNVVAAWPDVFSRILGEQATGEGIREVFNMLQDETLNKSFLYGLLDALLNGLFNAIVQPIDAA